MAERPTYLVPHWHHGIFFIFVLLTLAPTRLSAIPQFSRRYDLNCSACHTIVPVLNEQGYLFKRLGFHLPPALSNGQPAPTISHLVQQEPKWTLTNNLSAAVTDFSYQAQRTTQEGQSPVSSSGFQVNTWNSYAVGWIPDTNFFYVTEFDIVLNGSTSPNLTNAYFGYSGGNAKSSWYVDGGRQHLQMGSGSRAAQVYSLMPASPLMFENASSTDFMLDQSPVGLEAGYTLASNGYGNVLAATAKVTNGDKADGSEILGLSSKSGKDIWLDFDWWYAPESGLTYLDYYGSKDQLQNSGLTNQFIYRPKLHRQGVFANYMLHNKVDFLGGYLRSKDDWQYIAGTPGGYFLAHDFFGEVDYYIQPGLALAGRYDRLNQSITNSVGTEHIDSWTTAVDKNFTRARNVVGRVAYNYIDGRDPLSAMRTKGWGFQADIMFNF